MESHLRSIFPPIPSARHPNLFCQAKKKAEEEAAAKVAKDKEAAAAKKKAEEAAAAKKKAEEAEAAAKAAKEKEIAAAQVRVCYIDRCYRTSSQALLCAKLRGVVLSRWVSAVCGVLRSIFPPLAIPRLMTWLICLPQLIVPCRVLRVRQLAPFMLAPSAPSCSVADDAYLLLLLRKLPNVSHDNTANLDRVAGGVISLFRQFLATAVRVMAPVFVAAFYASLVSTLGFLPLLGVAGCAFPRNIPSTLR